MLEGSPDDGRAALLSCSILPRRGRGTAAGGGGVISAGYHDDMADHRVKVGQNIGCWDTECLHALALDPGISRAVSFRSIAT